MNRFPGNQNSLADAERQLADGYIDPATALPYVNEATPNPADSSFVYPLTGVINLSKYSGPSGNLQYGDFVPDDPVPGIPGTTFSDENFVAEILGYLALPAGTNVLGVNSGDGFALSIGSGTIPKDAFAPLAAAYAGARQAFLLFDGGTGSGRMGNTRSEFSLVVQQAGFYPVRLVWWQGSGLLDGYSAELEFCSISGGNRVLINDPTNAAAVKAYQAANYTNLYVRAVSPKPGATNTGPLEPVKVELVDGNTQLAANSVKLWLDGAQVAPTTNKVGGVTTVSYMPVTVAPACSAHTATLVFSDNGTPAATRTNTWTYTTADYFTIPASYAVSSNAVDLSATGFAMRVFQIQPVREWGDDEFSVSRAEWQLTGQRLMPLTSVPSAYTTNMYSTNLYPNLATPSSPGNYDSSGCAVYSEPGLINYSKDGSGAPMGGLGNFRPDALIPGIPGTNGSVDNLAMEVVTYLQLAPGVYTMGVQSDEGFRVTTAPNPLDAAGAVLGQYNSGHLGSDVLFYFVVTQAGYYPFRLIWFDGMGSLNQEGATFPNFDAYVEWFSVTPTGQKTLINDRSQAGAINAYRAVSVTKPYVASVTPASGAVRVAANTGLSLRLVDGSVTVVTNSIGLSLNGQVVVPAITRTGAVTTASYQPPSSLPALSVNTALWSYSDSAGSNYSRWVTFRVKRGGALQEDASGTVVVEAEDYDSQSPPSDPDQHIPYYWRFSDANPLPAKIDYAGDGHLHLTPNWGYAYDNTPSFVPRLDYQIIFANSGTHYIWARGLGLDSGADSFNAGIDGVSPDTGTASQRIDRIFISDWGWVGQAHGVMQGYPGLVAVVQVPSPGLHTFNVWMREDGFKLDRLLLTTNADFIPYDIGPPETALSALPLQLRIFRQGGSVVVSWDSLGTLQSADSVTGPWLDTPCASPQILTPAAARKFYRLRK